MERNALAGDLPLDAVDRRERAPIELLWCTDLLPNGVTDVPDQEALRSSGEWNVCVGDAMQMGESMLRVLSGGVCTSSMTGDMVDTVVSDVGRSIEVLLGLPGRASRDNAAGAVRRDGCLLGSGLNPNLLIPRAMSSSSCGSMFRRLDVFGGWNPRARLSLSLCDSCPFRDCWFLGVTVMEGSK